MNYNPYMQQAPMAPSYAGYNAPNFAFGQQTYPVMNNRLTALEQAVGGQQAQSMQELHEIVVAQIDEYKKKYPTMSKELADVMQGMWDEAHQHYIDKAAKYLKRVEVYRTLK